MWEQIQKQVKQYDLYARNLFETILYVNNLYHNDYSFKRIEYERILKLLTKDLTLLITDDDIRAYINKCNEESDKDVKNR